MGALPLSYLGLVVPPGVAPGPTAYQAGMRTAYTTAHWRKVDVSIAGGSSPSHGFQDHFAGRCGTFHVVHGPPREAAVVSPDTDALRAQLPAVRVGFGPTRPLNRAYVLSRDAPSATRATSPCLGYPLGRNRLCTGLAQASQQGRADSNRPALRSAP